MEVRKDVNIRLIDSLKFLPMKLSKLSSVFGLKEAKGWFPIILIKRKIGTILVPTQVENILGLNL